MKFLSLGIAALIIAVIVFVLSISNKDSHSQASREHSFTPERKRTDISGTEFRSRKENEDRTDFAHRPSDLSAVDVIADYRRIVKRRPPYRLIGTDGKLTHGAIEAASLTTEEAARIQISYDDLTTRMRAVLSNNMSKIENSGDDEKIRTYRIKPFKEEGERQFGEFLDSLSSIVGEQRAWQLAKSMPVDGMAGRLGANEIIISVADRESNFPASPLQPAEQKPSQRRARVEYRDPLTNDVVSSKTSFIGLFGQDLFGYIPE